MSDADALVDFLTERLDEEERTANAASPGPWHPNAENDEVVAEDGITVADGFALSNRQLRATVDHITRQDPQATLDRVAADRMILRWHSPADFGGSAWDCSICHREGDQGPYCPTLCALAYRYKRHPEYRAEWAPVGVEVTG